MRTNRKRQYSQDHIQVETNIYGQYWNSEQRRALTANRNAAIQSGLQAIRDMYI
jgi:hypothetical protein